MKTKITWMLTILSLTSLFSFSQTTPPEEGCINGYL